MSAWPDTYGGKVNCFGIPDTYRGWSIEQGPDDQFYATGPDYDTSWEGEEDGWVSNGQQVSAPTGDALREEIDAWLEENGPAASPPSRGSTTADALEAGVGREAGK